MRFYRAFKAFLAAWKNPEQAKKLIELKAEPSRQKGDWTHLRLLSDLQHAGRLVDFLKEDLSSFTDAQVGAAVRKIHRDCSQIIEELVTIRPLKEEKEGSQVTIPKGYNPMEIRIMGNVKGEPPFFGTLIHRGWKAHKKSLPKKADELGHEIIYPAEVEIT